jgi:hypothetical protein
MLRREDRLDRWIASMQKQGRVRFRWDEGQALPSAGTYVPPTIIALERARDLKEKCSARSCTWCAGRLTRLNSSSMTSRPMATR